MSGKIFHNLFEQDIKKENWPLINKLLLEEEEIKLPIQINGKMITTINAKKDYVQEDILKTIYKLEKIKSRLNSKQIIKVINVQNKIINILTN